jgi:hypothetical protein
MTFVFLTCTIQSVDIMEALLFTSPIAHAAKTLIKIGRLYSLQNSY